MIGIRRADRWAGMRWTVLALLCVTAASCSTTSKKNDGVHNKRSKEYFSEKEYGVKASPRVHFGKNNVPKGGGRFIVGKPYVVKGKVYKPREDKNYDKKGLASWYGSAFHGRLTANGEVYDQYHLSAAHPTFPLPSYARVTNLDTGDSVIVRVNDRGPYHPGRIIDVSEKAAEMLDIRRNGTANVRVQYVGKARMDGKDMPYLMASYTKKGDRLQRFNPQGEIATGVLVASADDRIPVPRQQPDFEPVSTSTALVADKIPSNDAFGALQQFAELPLIGPIPRERPSRLQSVNGALSAYAEIRIESASSPFDAIMVENDRQKIETIRNAAAQRLAAKKP